jgi:hypothetical protein
MDTSLLESRLLQDAVQRTRSKVIIGLSGDGHAPRLRRVFVLSMAATRGDEVPTVILEHTENVADFHAITLLGRFTTGHITAEA